VPNRLPERVRGQVAEILGMDERLLKDTAPLSTEFIKGNVEPRGAGRGAALIPAYGRWAGRMASSSSAATRCPKFPRRRAWRTFLMPMPST
jgi:hypothetical protein